MGPTVATDVQIYTVTLLPQEENKSDKHRLVLLGNIKAISTLDYGGV